MPFLLSISADYTGMKCYLYRSLPADYPGTKCGLDTICLLAVASLHSSSQNRQEMLHYSTYLWTIPVGNLSPQSMPADYPGRKYCVCRTCLLVAAGHAGLRGPCSCADSRWPPAFRLMAKPCTPSPQSDFSFSLHFERLRA
jgi:hypothetical protein